MIAAYSIAVTIACFAVAAWALVEALRNRPLGNALFYGLAAIEVLLLVLTIISIVRMASGDRPAELLTFVGYLLTVLLLIPIGVIWAIVEKSRWGCGVIVIVCAILPVLILRLHQIWAVPAS